MCLILHNGATPLSEQYLSHESAQPFKCKTSLAEMSESSDADMSDACANAIAIYGAGRFCGRLSRIKIGWLFIVERIKELT